MRRTFDVIHNHIIDFVIDFLQEHNETDLYNQIICSKLKLSRHTFYNHYKNVTEIFDEIKTKAKKMMSDAFTDYYDIKEHLIQGLNFVTNNKKIIIAVNKLDSNFFNEFYDKFEYAKYKNHSMEETTLSHKWLREIQFHGLEGFIKMYFDNMDTYAIKDIIDFLLNLSQFMKEAINLLENNFLSN